MNKEEYYKVSEDKKISLRCPCISSCSRYMFTAYYIGGTGYKRKSEDYETNMKEMGILDANDSIAKMLEAGEPVTLVGGNRSFYISNACPEFFLHPHQHKLCGMDNFATHSYSYDEYFVGSKFKPGESRHYTECPEYSLFISKNKALKVKKIRKTVINTTGNGNIINTGNQNNITSKINILKSNRASLELQLRVENIEDTDLQELLAIIDHDIFPGEEKKFGQEVNNWIKKMLGKAVDGSWNIPVGTAGLLLTNAIASYYGW